MSRWKIVDDKVTLKDIIIDDALEFKEQYSEDFDKTHIVSYSSNGFPDRVEIFVKEDGDYAVEVQSYIGNVAYDAGGAYLNGVDTATFANSCPIYISKSTFPNVEDYTAITYINNYNVANNAPALNSFTDDTSSTSYAFLLTRFNSKKVACSIPLFADSSSGQSIFRIKIDGLTENNNTTAELFFTKES